MKSYKNLFLILFFFFSQSIFAQSGRIIPPTPTPTVEPPKVEDSKKDFPDCELNLEKHIYISPKKIVEFTKELNRYGNCGYRLEKSNKIPLGVREPEFNSVFFAVMKLDAPNRYEYQWFEAYRPGEAQTRMNIRAKQGFYFKASYPFQLLAENEDGSFSDIATNELRSTYGTFLIFEKKAGELKQREYRVLLGGGIGKKIKERNQNNLNSASSKGFRPVGIIKEGERFAIVMEQENDFAPKDEYLILNERWGVNKKLGSLGESRYKILFIYPEFSLLVKVKKNLEPVTIKSFLTQEDIIKDPSKINGMYYELCGLSYMNNEDLYPELYFSLPKNQKQIYFEYKLHKMTNVDRRPKGIDKYDALRQPPTAEMLVEFQNLLKQGYIIREVLASKEIYILFERPKQ